MKIVNISDSNGTYRKKQKNGIKTFLKISKYDLAPAMVTGSIATTLLTPIYSQSGVIDVMLFGSVSAAAFTLAVNGIITGIKVGQIKRNTLKMK